MFTIKSPRVATPISKQAVLGNCRGVHYTFSMRNVDLRIFSTMTGESFHNDNGAFRSLTHILFHG